MLLLIFARRRPRPIQRKISMSLAAKIETLDSSRRKLERLRMTISKFRFGPVQQLQSPQKKFNFQKKREKWTWEALSSSQERRLRRKCSIHLNSHFRAIHWARWKNKTLATQLWKQMKLSTILQTQRSHLGWSADDTQWKVDTQIMMISQSKLKRRKALILVKLTRRLILSPHPSRQTRIIQEGTTSPPKTSHQEASFRSRLRKTTHILHPGLLAVV